MHALNVWSVVSSDCLIPNGCLDFINDRPVSSMDLVEYVDSVYKVIRETRRDDLNKLVCVKKDAIDDRMLKGMIIMRHLLQ